MKKNIFAALSMIFVLVFSVMAYADEWIQKVDGSWYLTQAEGIWYATQNGEDVWYQKHDGTSVAGEWKKSDGKWYQLDQDGYAVRNGQVAVEWWGTPTPTTTSLAAWTKKDDKWLRIDESGKFLTNAWFQDTDGKWYYLGSDGAMLVDTTTPDGYYVGTDGVWAR